MSDAFNEAADESVAAQKRLLESLREFRGSIQNDLKSISAAGERVRDEVRKIAGALDSAVGQLGSHEMQAALSNAERLVVALQAIHDLKSTRLAFAVMGDEPEKVTPFTELPAEERREWGRVIKSDAAKATA